MYLSVRDTPVATDGVATGVGPSASAASAAPAAPAATGAATRVGSTVVLLGVVSLLTDVSSEMVAAVLPVYLTIHLGLGYAAYGVVDGLYQGATAIVRIGGGYLADRSGRPKWIAVAGYATSAVSRIALLPVSGLAAVGAVLAADRLGKGIRTGPRDALIADACDASARGRAFGVHRALDSTGAALGPLAAFALFLAFPAGYGSGYGSGGFDSVFVVSFAIAVVGVAVLVLFVPDRRRVLGAAPVTAGLILRQLAGRRLRRSLVAIAILGAVTVGDGFIYLSLRERADFAVTFFPLLFVGTNVVYLALAIPVGRLADRIGAVRVLVYGHGWLLACYLVAGSRLDATVATLACLVLLGAFYAATDGVLPALVSTLVAANARASGIAAAQTAVAVARFGCAVAFGVAWTVYGRVSALTLAAALLGVAIPLAALLLARTGRPAGEEPDAVARESDAVARESDAVGGEGVRR